MHRQVTVYYQCYQYCNCFQLRLHFRCTLQCYINRLADAYSISCIVYEILLDMSNFEQISMRSSHQSRAKLQFTTRVTQMLGRHLTGRMASNTAQMSPSLASSSRVSQPPSSLKPMACMCSSARATRGSGVSPLLSWQPAATAAASSGRSSVAIASAEVAAGGGGAACWEVAAVSAPSKSAAAAPSKSAAAAAAASAALAKKSRNRGPPHRPRPQGPRRKQRAAGRSSGRLMRSMGCWLWLPPVMQAEQRSKSGHRRHLNRWPVTPDSQPSHTTPSWTTVGSPTLTKTLTASPEPPSRLAARLRMASCSSALVVMVTLSPSSSCQRSRSCCVGAMEKTACSCSTRLA
ncbi:hypothetical protein BOX15_Mlig002695g1 [Macrostomum lignano]|uniref:Uncharacterized protein n=1 Tax=Macrostomum lignano TaxID=282301 RepID=A0A267G1I8_9PLAT|nr:hypothetical protein BOX15_Mlig002695g1 [Macrostomum lignano]